MVQISKIQEGLFGIVGLRQPLDPSLPILSDANKTSRSGLYVDDIQPFKLKLFKDTQEFIAITDEQLNDVLEQVQKTSITNVMFKVFDQGDYIDRNYLYSNANSRTKVVNIANGTVFGWKIEVEERKNLAFKIGRVRLEFDFDGATHDVKLYLMNSFLSEPIKQKEITLTRKDQIEELQWIVDSTDNDYKGYYYLLIQSVSGERLQPFERNIDDSNEMNDIAFLEFEGVMIPNFNAENFNFEPERYISQNVGINPDVIVYDDFTDFVIQSQFMFARAIQLEMAIYLMSQIAGSTRSNQNERMAREIVAMMQVAINGQENVNKGLDGQLWHEVASLKKEVKKLKQSFFQGMISISTNQ